MNRLTEIIFYAWEEDLKDTDPRRIARETLCDDEKEVAMLDALLYEERKEAFDQGFREAIRLLID
ncbi:MAG: hypothetical protein K2K06_05220 [Oscillospiraceae bacterium]|nr:hypothetical protein [Oscillospiraceae bacterium]